MAAELSEREIWEAHNVTLMVTIRRDLRSIVGAWLVRLGARILKVKKLTMEEADNDLV